MRRRDDAVDATCALAAHERPGPAGAKQLGRVLPVTRARGLSRADMHRNTYQPRVSVPPGDAPVSVDGVPVPVHEADSLPLTRLYQLG